MAIPPVSSDNSVSSSPATEPGPSRIRNSTSNKRAASAPLSDSETLVTMHKKSPQSVSSVKKTNIAVLDAYKRRRKKKKLPVPRNSLQASKVRREKSSTSPKGKERDVIEEGSRDEPNVPPTVEKEDNEVLQLRKKIEDQTTLLTAHKEFLTSLAPSITCQICLDPMYRPFTLAPCGHTACYDCLLAWFRAPPAHITMPPPEHLAFNFDPNEPALLARDAPMLLRKEKTCPHCRAVVRDAPVEAWGIKDIVHHLFNHKGDVAKDLYPSYARPEEANQAGGNQPGIEAWRGVFKRQTMLGTLAVTNGRGEGIHDDDDDANGPRPFYDEEDDVYRCTECYHELVGGLCTSCGLAYRGYRHDLDDEDEDEEVDAGHWMDAEEFDGLHDDPIDLDYGYAGVDPDAIGFRNVLGALGFRPRDASLRPEHNGDENGEDEDGYESSFIDDEEDHTRMEEYHSAEEDGANHNYESEDEEMTANEDESYEDHPLPRRVPPPRVDGVVQEGPHVRLGTVEVEASDSDEDEPRIHYHPIRRNRILVDSDSDDGEDSDGVAGAPPTLRHDRDPRLFLDDSDFEQYHPLRSVRAPRTFGRRRYVSSLSDEGSRSGEISDHSDHSSRHESSRGSLSGLSHENYENYTFSDEEEGIMWSD